MSYVRKIGSIGGSDVGPILGLSKYKTPAQQWDRIMGLVRDNEDEEEPFYRIRGNHLESHIARLFTAIAGFEVAEMDRHFHPDYPMLHCSADRRIVTTAAPDGILEIKSLGPWTFRKMLDEGVDPCYYAQLQHYLFVTGMQWGMFAVLNADISWVLLLPESEWKKPAILELLDEGFRTIPVSRDEEWLGSAIPRLLEWHQLYVEGNTRPPEEQVSEPLFPRARVGAEAEDWTGKAEFNVAVMDLLRASEAFKLAEHHKKTAQARVKEMMGDVEVALSKHGKVSFKEGTRRDFDKEKLLLDHPEFDTDQYYKMSVTRALRVSNGKA